MKLSWSVRLCNDFFLKGPKRICAVFSSHFVKTIIRKKLYNIQIFTVYFFKNCQEAIANPCHSHVAILTISIFYEPTRQKLNQEIPYLFFSWSRNSNDLWWVKPTNIFWINQHRVSHLAIFLPFLNKFGSKRQHLIKVKFDFLTNSNMLNSMMMLTFSILDRRFPFWANFLFGMNFDKKTTD